LQSTRKWRWGVHRWWVLLFIILNVVAVSIVAPVQPHIQVAPEKLIEKPLFTLPFLGDFYIFNTLIATIFVDLIILALAWAVRRAVQSGNLVPGGISGVVEALVEILYNLTESTAGKAAKKIFPWFATIIILVLVMNLIKLIPGFETIGILHPVEGGHPVQPLFGSVFQIMPGESTEGGEGYSLIPFLRGPSTDLNFTLTLALISVLMTQVIGVQVQGPAYFKKFINVTQLFKKPFFGVMDFLVGFLELISEFAKILSFAFRLFGNMFAGMVLVALIGALVPVFMPSFIFLFEIFVGVIQALVFGMLTMIFMAQATHGHGSEG
jgi:F-type H+-transporting ATPase subunit a